MSKFFLSQRESSKQFDVQKLFWCCVTVFGLWAMYRVRAH
uniref:Uncharacterized protein n=1 Tax=Arundo donax TaxID=35708 RepID=A0A0A9ADS4_ARUDO